MATVKLTSRAVAAATPDPARDVYLWDTEVRGFGLKITPAGSKSYLLKYRVGSGRGARVRRFTIGSPGSPWTPTTARAEALRLMGDIAAGVDPMQERSDRARELTVAELCDLWLAEGCTTKRESTIAMDRSRIRAHVKPLLGRRHLRSIERGDVERFLRDVAAGKTAAKAKTGKARGLSRVRGGRGAATRTVGMLGSIFEFAVARGLLDSNPARGVKRWPDEKRERFLSAAELARLGDVLRASAGSEHPSAIAAVRLLALTGCRKAEILGLRWEHVDLELGALRLPTSKTGAKVVHLGPPAVQLLSTLPRTVGCPFVLPGHVEGSHFRGLQKAWVRIRERAGLEDVRLHDLRHSFASVGAAGGDSLLIIGSLLGHRKAATTQRYAHLSQDPVKDAAGRIAGRIAAAMDGGADGEVVELRGHDR